MAVDPMGAIIAELRAANIASQRVRGGEPGPGDAQPKGSFQRFVVLTRLAAPRLHRTPMQTVRLGVRAYSATPQDAAALYGEVSDALDNVGPRISASGVPIYRTLDDTGGSADKDPDTGQPLETGVIEVWAGTEAIAGS